MSPHENPAASGKGIPSSHRTNVIIFPTLYFSLFFMKLWEIIKKMINNGVILSPHSTFDKKALKYPESNLQNAYSYLQK